MDSESSGSLQSSSGGEEEYDSRTDMISASAFMNSSATHVGPVSAQQPPPPPVPLPPPPQHGGKASMVFHPSSNYHENPSGSQLLNLEMVWSKTVRSDHTNCADRINPLMVSPSSFQPQFDSQNQNRVPFSIQDIAVSFGPPVTENISSTINSTSASTSANIIAARALSSSSDQAHVVRNPRKRSRASRRAPTTVLTTDTTNFRAMVQEFTGIPAPPFNSSSSFPRSRLDLFAVPSGMRFNRSESTLPQPPYHIHRPFPQKVQQPAPFFSFSSSSPILSPSIFDALGAISSGSGANNTICGSSIDSSTVSYQSLFKQPMQTANFFSMQNPILTSLLQSNPPKTSLANSTVIGSNSRVPMQIPSDESHLKMGLLDEFGVGGHSHVNSNVSGLPGLVSSNQTMPKNDNNPASWRSGAGSNADDNQSQVRSLDGCYDLPRNAANGELLSYPASSSNFRGDKGMTGVAARSEGMVETWICSSD